MPDSQTQTLFIDTSSLRSHGFRHPDFQKLLLRSREGSLRIVVSHIACEEWRASLLDTACEDVRAIRNAFQLLKNKQPTSHVLSRLPTPTLGIWEDKEMERASKDFMEGYVAENRIEIVPIATDHGARTWEKFFDVNVKPPLNPSKNRENRRKDIPDSWIFEAAVDLVAREGDILALCQDATLSEALCGIGVRVFTEAQQVADALDPESQQDVEAGLKEDSSRDSKDPLSESLSGAQDRFRDLELKVIGYVAYLDTPSKNQLFELLSNSGVSRESANNVAERLVIAGIVKDTGNHYLITDGEFAQSAAIRVENEIIDLLSES